VITALQPIRCVFLDRDGVINRKPPEGAYVTRWSEFHILPGVEDAISALNRAGYLVIVVSNQRGIALGHSTAADVEALHARLQQLLAAREAHIDAFYFCPHDKNGCGCRKPKTGLFEQAFRDFPAASRANSIVIGDSLSDIEAAENLGVPSIFVDGDPATQKPGAPAAIQRASRVCHSLPEAVALLLAERASATA
jgi:D-glycero-D-manno-heptose 1,7-bisphosphate phosphatase